MINLSQVNFKDILPSSIGDDPTVKAAANALDGVLKQTTADALGLAIYEQIDTMPESILTHLAYQFHVDFWDDALTLEEKRGLVKSAFAWHKIKGTPAAVEMIGAIVFDSMELLEWFDYDGIPTHFKLKTGDHVKGAEFYTRLFNLVDIAKNARSFLKSVIITKEKTNPGYIGGAVRSSKKITLVPYSEISTRESSAYAGGVVRTGNKIKINVFTLHLEVGQGAAFVSGVVRNVTKYQIKGVV